ncbi:hypothetical protein NQ318_022170 [Aromia moschata]|uniref:Uncharacterized protein n=1 Tax=Aromia moschata TaxID=1265417 RepID=A0AAV8Z7G3_9CUCU|nr:hypothetical protein NQ318_022170 [Aromia moschata]
MLKTVGIIFVSDLFLQGKKHESLQNLLNELNLLDYEVEKVSIVPEHEKLITYELDVLVKQCDIVLVIGELNNDGIKETPRALQITAKI